MKRLGIVVLIFVAGLAGCAKHYRDTALYHSSGRAKPLVALLPVIDSTGKRPFKWDISEELTTELRARASESSRIYLLNQEGGVHLAQALNVPEIQAVSSDAYDALAPAEFVVVSELIEQEESIYGLKNAKNAKGSRPHLNEVGTKITLAMRVRVVDLRGKEPKIVLQEVVSEDLKTGTQYLHTDYARTPWGSPGFVNTPLGMAHNKLVCSMLAHIEGYIGL